MSRCKICNGELGDVPMCFGSKSPALQIVPSDEYEKRVEENEDQCIIDDEYFFVRAHIELPIIDSDETFIWSVWVSLSEESFVHMSENWDVEGREKSEPYFAWIMTNLPCYPETMHLKASVQSQPVGYVPQVRLESSEHLLSQEQINGIKMERVYEIVHQVMQH